MFTSVGEVSGLVIHDEACCSHGSLAVLCDDAGCRGPLVDLGLAPGARSAVQLEVAGEMPGLLSRVEVLDVVEAAERQMRWLEGLRTRMVAEFHARHPADCDTAPPGADESGRLPSQRWVPTEVGLSLGISRLEALGLIERARRFVEVLPDTLAELEKGRIDVRRAEAIARATAVLPDDKARQVEARVLPKAHDATLRQVQDRLRRAVARVDPDGEYRRHKEADRGRRVSIRSLEDGMASLWFYGSAAEIEAAWQMADRLARSLGAEDPRTLDQRRFDLAMQVLQGRLTVTDLADLEAAVTEILADHAAETADNPAERRERRARGDRRGRRRRRRLPRTGDATTRTPTMRTPTMRDADHAGRRAMRTPTGDGIGAADGGADSDRHCRSRGCRSRGCRSRGADRRCDRGCRSRWPC